MESLDMSNDESSSSNSSDTGEYELDKNNIDPSMFASEKYKQLFQESTLTHLIIKDEKEELEHNIKLMNEQIEQLKVDMFLGRNEFSTTNKIVNLSSMYHEAFWLREENEIERLKAIESDKKYSEYSRIDLYNVPPQ